MDYDADGVLDFISGSYDPGDVYLCRGTGQGQYASVRAIEDRDGLRLVHHPRELREFQRLRDDPHADDREKIQARVASFGSWATPVDWDDDGDLDLVIGSFGGELFRRENVGSREAPIYDAASVRVEAAGAPLSVPMHAAPVAADWDADGRWDLVVGAGDGSVSWFRNVGQRAKPAFGPRRMLIAAKSRTKFLTQYTAEGASPRPGVRAQIDVTDYDRDGDLDLLVGDYSKVVALRKLDPEEQQQFDRLRRDEQLLVSTLRDLRGDESASDPDHPVRRKLAEVVAAMQGFYAGEASRTSSHVWLYRRRGEPGAGTSVELIDGKRWTTRRASPPVGDPAAEKGGTLRVAIPTDLQTLRQYGPNSRNDLVRDIYALTHETLLDLHPETLELVPALATHWRRSEDGSSVSLRLDPRARFATGEPVTASDVVASFDFVNDPAVMDAVRRSYYEAYLGRPEVEDTHTVRFPVKESSWRVMHAIAGLSIYPGHVVRNLAGEDYLRDYNQRTLPGSGPYEFRDFDRDVQPGVRFALTRRADYWAKDLPRARNLYNFDRLELTVVRDRLKRLIALKADQLDVAHISNSARWVRETDFEAVAKGWIQKRKVYTQKGQGASGYLFNLRRWPFDDANVRRAFCFAVDRTTMIDRLFYGEYEPIDSYFPGGIWANPDLRPVEYDPERAGRFLDRAGYTKRNTEGIRVHETTGRPLSITLEFWNPGEEKFHRLVQQNLRAVGIELDLQRIDRNMLLKLVAERKFQVYFRFRVAGVFPSPRQSFHSEGAHRDGSGNRSGFTSLEVDGWIEEYDRALDQSRRIELIHAIDRAVYREYPSALAWYAPFDRLLYWNRFGMPTGLLPKYGTHRAVWSTWWFDPSRATALESARAAGQSLPIGETIVDHWRARN